jgi:hypothetical protein
MTSVVLPPGVQRRRLWCCKDMVNNIESNTNKATSIAANL